MTTLTARAAATSYGETTAGRSISGRCTVRRSSARAVRCMPWSPNDWHIQGTGDFDADNTSDILWRHDSGQTYIWEMGTGLNVKAEGTIVHAAVPNDWHIQGTGDFDADGKTDILWRHDSGQTYI